MSPPEPRPEHYRHERTEQVEVSVMMPCLNEAASVSHCLQQALQVFEQHGLQGEVVVCDNGSEDGSAEGSRPGASRRRRYGTSANERGYQLGVGLPLQGDTFSQLVPLVPEEGPTAFDTLEGALGARERLSQNLGKPLAVYEVSIKPVFKES